MQGRIPGRPRQSPKAAPAANASAHQVRLARRNKAKQTQANKRASLISAARLFNGVDGAPRIVALIPLTPDVSAKSVSLSLAQSLDLPTDSTPEFGVWKMKFVQYFLCHLSLIIVRRAERFKTSLQLIHLNHGHFYECMDACKVADYVVFILSPTVEVDVWGDTLLRTLQAQGLPDVVTAIPSDSSSDPKASQGILKSLLSFIQYFVPSQSKVFDLHSTSDSLNMVRALSEGNPGDVRWREGRSWLLGESCTWDDGILNITGVVRGASLSANRLVHIPKFGDFQIHKVCTFTSPSMSLIKV